MLINLVALVYLLPNRYNIKLKRKAKVKLIEKYILWFSRYIYPLSSESTNLLEFNWIYRQFTKVNSSHYLPIPLLNSISLSYWKFFRLFEILVSLTSWISKTPLTDSSIDGQNTLRICCLLSVCLKVYIGSGFATNTFNQKLNILSCPWPIYSKSILLNSMAKLMRKITNISKLSWKAERLQEKNTNKHGRCRATDVRYIALTLHGVKCTYRVSIVINSDQ